MSKIKIDKLVRTNRRTIAIIVTQDAQLIVRAPLGIKDNIINDFINKKSNWIIKKQEQANLHIPIEKVIQRIEKLRTLLKQMDEAVLKAYGWSPLHLH